MLSFLHLVTLCALFAALKATQPECIVGAVDLAFVIDGSQSVGSTNFKTVLDAVVQATRLTNIGPLEEDSRVAMVIFDETAHVEFGLMNTTNADVEAAILRSKYTNINGVNIAAGMDAAVRKIFNRAYPPNRTAPKLLIIITSNSDQSDVRAANSLVREVNAIPAAIGITKGNGIGAKMEQLEIAAGDRDRVAMTTDYSSLKDILQKLFCKIGPSRPIPPSVTVKPDSVPAKTARGCDCDYSRTWMDLIFVFDSSLAINKYDFYAVRNFVASFVKKIPVSQKEGAYSRVGIINVADSAHVIGDLHAYADSTTAYNALRNMPHLGKPSMNLKEGLVAAQNMIASATDRPNVRKVVVVFTTKDELCSYQQKTMKKQEVELTALDDNPCAVASRITESGNILLTVGIKFDGALYFPQLNLGSQCFKLNFDENFSYNFLNAMCKANCYCLSPYVQYKRDEACVEYGECLYTHGVSMNYEAAKDTCSDYQGTLVDVFSADKEAFITEIQTPHHVSGSWLALEAINGVYQWNGENITRSDYTNWGPSQPQMANGDCVAFEPKRGWISKSCDDIFETSYFVCQKKSCDSLHYCDFKTFKALKAKIRS